MISYLELVYICLIAILFVFLFKIQQKISPQHYFSNSQFILDRDVSYKMLGIRYLLILLFSLNFYLIFSNRIVIVAGIFLGSFLIIWPILIAPSEAYCEIGYIKLKDKVLIYLLHFVFVISSTFVAYFAIIFFPLLKDLFIEYKSNALKELIKYFIGFIVISPLEKIGKDYLNRSVINNKNLIDHDE